MGKLLLGVLLSLSTLAAADLAATIKDRSGGLVPDASIEVRTASGIVLAVVQSSSEGRFLWPDAKSGQFILRISKEGFADRELVVTFPLNPAELVIQLEPRSVQSKLTVTATRGGAEETELSPQVAIIRDSADVLKRPTPTMGNVLESQPGILVQQSTYGQVSPFLRGLTGYQVLNLVDGLRFNNSTFRSGPNQYLAYVEPTQAQRVEALLGPTGSQYGSDSLGGTIHVLTQEPRFSDVSTMTAHGDVSMGGATADLSGFGAARVSIANERVFGLVGVSGRVHNDLRAGGGDDSRNVYHRLFGMPAGDVQDLIGDRQQDSGFRQYGFESKFAARIRPDQLLSLYYQRGVQDEVRGYKDLLGGLGRMLSTFEPQTLNWFYGRYEKTGLGFLDTLSGTFSVNSQTDGSSRQNLRFTDSITRDLNRVNAYGYTGQGTTHWGSRALLSFGGELYDERIGSARDVTNPVSGSVSRPRPLYPNHSGYRNGGLFGQGSYEIGRGMRASAGVRYTNVGFSTRRDTAFGIPESSQTFHDVTFHTTLSWQATSHFGLHGVVSRGFRAPNLNDLGALGLNDLGYEIPSADAIPAGALLSTDSGESALSKGTALTGLAPESLRNYEFGVRFTTRRLYARVQAFGADLYDPIVRRTLLFPATAPPQKLAGLAVSVLPQTTGQRAQGVVAVATELDPRAVKSFVNDGRSRYYGMESLARWAITDGLSFEANYSYLVGRDLNPNRNIRRLPPQMGAATLRYQPSGRRPWVEGSLSAAGAQDRLSGGDLDDERIGASRRRRDISDFFGGSRVAPLLDGAVFRPTGETLGEIQNRVLPIGAVINGVRVVDDNTRVPLYLSTAGWTTVSIRSGFPIGERWQVFGAVENLLDRNYRHHGSGIDSPGVSGYLCLRYRF